MNVSLLDRDCHYDNYSANSPVNFFQLRLDGYEGTALDDAGVDYSVYIESIVRRLRGVTYN